MSALTWSGAAWAASTAYIIGARVINGGKVYRCTSPGTSASSGGPTGTGSAIIDNTVTWEHKGTAVSTTVLGLAPELSTTAALTQALCLDEADREVNPDEWGDGEAIGCANLAAHIATLSRLKGKGPVASESVGSISRSYGSLTSFGELGTTVYGLEFLRLVRLCPAALGVVP